MKSSIMIFLFLVALVISVSAQVLPTDLNGETVQLSRYFTTVSDTIPSQLSTVADSIAVPTNAAEVIIVARHNAIYIRPKATATTTGLAASWVYLPKDIPLRLPVMDAEYIVYRSATVAASINITWLRM